MNTLTRIFHKKSLFSDRTSCMNWLPDQLRVLLSAVAYTLMEALRRLGLYGTQMANARCQCIRLKLLKIGLVVLNSGLRSRLLACYFVPAAEKSIFLLISCKNRLNAVFIDTFRKKVYRTVR